MNLQQTIDIIHDIRERFSHIETCLTTAQGNDSRYIIGVATPNWRLSWVISGAWDYQEALLWWRIFSNQQ